MGMMKNSWRRLYVDLLLRDISQHCKGQDITDQVRKDKGKAQEGAVRKTHRLDYRVY
ncbi:MAG: hypothetical protein OET55_06085 [Desulfuromonadales bacterium]|jgi:hypothetical protein|nr:hypothetical protein [Desulfuromonadales bacterium]MDH4024676.1 hypothetical protein [Desulfuromonadales bacterium]